jgi:DNA processing protein
MHGMTLSTTRRGSGRYKAPTRIAEISLNEALRQGERSSLDEHQLDLLRSSTNKSDKITLYIAGNPDLFRKPSVSIVGTREVSEHGRARARRLAKELVDAGVVIVSGLAKGVDTAALTSAIDADGDTIAVIGTPLQKAYPAENSSLQEEIYSHHLLVSPFAKDEATFKSNFPKRNRVMAAISDATVIIEASDSSGTLHQAAECQRLKRWLFITKSVATDTSLTWPSRFIGKEMVKVLSDTSDIIDLIGRK